MKLASVIVATSLLTAPAFAVDNRFIAADDRIETRLCLSAATAPLVRWTGNLAHSGFDYRTVGRHLLCNGEPLAVFSARYNDDRRIAQRIGRYSPVQVQQRVQITELSRGDSPIEVRGKRL
ncbi:hypothetical protein FCL40_00850 [Ferrimonas sediminicola]|uniref:DUF3718 domain-containing protein n=1 Tax=Ferrimonas sediminicola TaxID=2569538 RepID=A0A4U1BI38_9GAMM|nr:hypothetical protein [Ferrimonas sediminicola]TKB51136.1 hypothetical protein FCL40_00850 [Ferrimonas sediminicola]